ncbi:MAG: chitobiase/beta-hexosaminidase C-terminal domain-containing protein [Acidobacteria bacterium]|nr:chitobiase/beta-hexosaminidase C-terminal domain-containing protein [Acidobacteriota bacterium]
MKERKTFAFDEILALKPKKKLGTRLLAATMVLVICMPTAGPFAEGMQSAHYAIPKVVASQGSGFRGGAIYQVPSDLLTDQPVETSVSENYIVHGRPLVTVDSLSPTGGIVINQGAAATASVNVNLQLIAGHASGVTEVQLSNNGVGWTAAEPYTTTKAWVLPAIDGTRKVFARFKSGNGYWSGPVWDSILLDTRAPTVSISPTGGTYMGGQLVAVTASEPATIKYTLDETDPVTSPTAQVYQSPVYLDTDRTLKAYATDALGNAGPVASETYEICSGGSLGIAGTVTDATRQNAPMPLVVITLESGQSTNTDLNGHYAFTGLPVGWYKIASVTAPKPGYVTYQSKLKLCKTSLTHDITLTMDGTVYGTDTSAGYSADGVNTSTGNFAYKMSDLALPGVGPSFVFERAYNSQDRTAGPLGIGWTWGYNISLTEETEGEIVVRWGDGRIEVWKPDGSGGYTPMYGSYTTLVKNPDTTFTLKRKDRVEYRFNLDRKLSAVVDEFGNTIAFAYTGGNLTAVTDTAGRPVTLSYDAANRITNVLDPIGRSVSFAYDVSGNLVAATDMAGQTTRYTYDENHQLLTLKAPDGTVVLTNTYDPARAVVTCQRDALGNETRYVYDVPTKTTTIIDAEGNSSYHTFDSHLRLVQEKDGRGYSSYRTYDERGNMASAKDKRGNTTTYAYDDRGNVLTKTEPLGRVTAATYDADNNPLTKTDALGHTTVFAYDPANGNLLASYACGAVPAGSCTSDPTVARTTYTYDPVTGKLLTVTEATGTPLQRTTTNQYDTFGNLVAVIDAMGNTSTYTYDAVGRKVMEEHPLGRATAYEYDAMDRLVSVTDALGNRTQFTYDVNGNKVLHVDANLYPTTFAYDAKGQLVTKTDALGGIEHYYYDGLGRRSGVTNARNATATIVYDAVGNVIQEIDALGNVVRHEYDANGNKTATFDARGNQTTFIYDALNRIIRSEEPLGNSTNLEYDFNGNKIKSTNAQSAITQFVYDAFDRMVTVTDALGNSNTTTYDLLGRIVRVSDSKGSESTYTYDILDRLLIVSDPITGSASSTYDAIGNRISIIDTRGMETVYTYDRLNRPLTETNPLGNSVVRNYDATGNLLTLSNADGTTTYTHDPLGRVTEMTLPDLTTVAYMYDARGNRLRVIDSTGTTTYTYDLLDQVASVTDPFGLTVGYTYDPDGNRNGLIYPGNRRVTYIFDAMDRVVSVQDWGGTATTYIYDNTNRLSSQIMGNGNTVTYSYNEVGRITCKEDKTSSGIVIASYHYILDPNGNPTGVSILQPLLPEPPIQVDQIFTVNDGNQVIMNNSTAFSYDGNGNRLTAFDGYNSIEYFYDFNSRLTHVTSGSDEWDYLYTSDGKRIATTENGVQTRYLLDQTGEMESILAELTPENSIKRYYIYGDGLQYSIDETVGERSFYHYDPLGNTVALTDLYGSVTDSYAYLPFGEISRYSGPHKNPFTYTGKFGVTQERNGLYFMRARFYDPNTRTFLSQDEIGGVLGDPQSLNRYSYAKNNPMVNVDPTGTNIFKAAFDTWELVTSIVDFGHSALDFARNPSAGGATDLAIDMADLTINVVEFGVDFTWRDNPVTGLIMEGIEFGNGIRQGWGSMGSQWKPNFSGGNVLGYIAGAWIREGYDSVIHSDINNCA